MDGKIADIANAFSKLYKLTVNEVTFMRFRGVIDLLHPTLAHNALLRVWYPGGKYIVAD